MQGDEQGPWWWFSLIVRLDERELEADQRRRAAARSAGRQVPLADAASYSVFVAAHAVAAELLARSVEKTGPH